MSKEEREWLAERSLGAYALILGGLVLIFLITDGIIFYSRGEPIAHPLVYAFIAMVAGLLRIVDKALKRQRTEIMELRHKIGRLGKGVIE